MVSIGPVPPPEPDEKKEEAKPAAEPPTTKELPASEERLLDAAAIEVAASKMHRISARVHLEALAKKLRKEGAALARVEESRAKLEAASAGDESRDTKTTLEAYAAASSSAAPAPEPVDAAASSAPAPPAKLPVAPTKATASSTTRFSLVDRFSFDDGGYSGTHVTLYVPLSGVGSIPRENITCDFTPTSFDLIVRGLHRRNYRMFNDNLEHDIDPVKSKIRVKADKIIMKLAKVKGEYGFDHWSALTAKKSKKSKANKEDPTAGLMDMMKDMYDEGDDNMKKMIGETMLKQREGKLDGPGGMDDMGMGGMGGI